MSDDQDEETRRDDALREHVQRWFEETYPGYSVQDFVIVASGQTLEQTLGDGDSIDSAWSWITGRGQVPYRTSGLLDRAKRVIDRNAETQE